MPCLRISPVLGQYQFRIRTERQPSADAILQLRVRVLDCIRCLILNRGASARRQRCHDQSNRIHDPSLPRIEHAHTLTEHTEPVTETRSSRRWIAASLGDPAIPVHLRAVLGNLDARSITLVTDAITTANG
jgi:hypothetical protein